MRIALPVWIGRISPVFDVARHVRVVETEENKVARKEDVDLEDGNRVERLRALAVDVLICAAISRQLEAAFWVAGIEVVSEVCGRVDEVIEAYLNGSLAEEEYLTPGHTHHCHGFAEHIGRQGEDFQRSEPHPESGVRHH
jgi:predicted Fe-Mo cluster-binding NifX family protein